MRPQMETIDNGDSGTQRMLRLLAVVGHSRTDDTFPYLPEGRGGQNRLHAP